MSKNPLVKIVTNTFLQFWGKILSAGLSAVSILILTRYLGVQGYGNFSLVFAFLTFFSAFTDFGLQTTIVNKLSKKETTEEEIFGTYFFIKILIIIITTVSSLIILIFMPYSSFVKTAILFSSVGVGIGALGGFGNTFFQYRIRVDLITIIDIINKALTVVLIFAFFILRLNFFFVLSSVLISNLISILIMFMVLRKSIKFDYKFDKSLARQIIIDSAPLGFAGFLSITYFKLDTIMLSIFRGAGEVGIYSLAYKIFENVLIIWTFYMVSFYPYFSRFHHSGDWIKYKKIIKESALFGILLSFVILILGFIFAPLIVRIFGGNGFESVVFPLRILLFSSIFFFMNSILYFYFFIKEKINLIILSLLCSLILNFLINFLIIPKYGYIGASITTVITEIFLFICYIVLYFLIKIKK